MKTTSILGAAVVAMIAVACGGDKPAEPPAQTAANVTPTAAPTTPATDTTSPTPAPTTPAPAPAKAATPEETTKALVDAWNTHDTDKIVAAYADSGMLRISGGPDLTGRAAIKAGAGMALKALPDFKVAVTRVTMKGNVAAVEWVINGTNTGDNDMTKMKATGRKVGLHGVDMVTFDDAGLIKEDHRYENMPTEMSQLDAKAKAGTFRAVETLPTGAPTVAASKGTPEEQKNLDAANAVYKALSDRKIDALMGLLTADASMDDYTAPALMKTPKEMKAFTSQLFTAIPDVAFDKSAQIAAGDLVVTEGNFHGTMKGSLGPMKATNKPTGMHFVDVMQMKDGKAMKVWSYGNSMEMMPPPPAAK